MTVLDIFNALYTCYGKQHWWPADSPFEVMVGAILTQNTSWSNVEKAIGNLKSQNLLDPDILSRMDQNKLGGYITSAGYFNLKAKRLINFCKWYTSCGGYEALNKQGTGQLRQALLSVNGVGEETADDMLLYAFARPVFVIDAYTRRIFSRIGLVNGEETYQDLRVHFEESLKNHIKQASEQVDTFNEYHALIVLHAKNICQKSPRCESCCISRQCLRKGLNDTQ
ncbi:MAG: endonuclease III domain-containing protein [Gammaproteobacteria bacterium]